MTTKKPSFWLTPKGLAALGLIAAASYFLLVEHRQHVWQFLPYLILLASAWNVLHKAQQSRSLATTGWYARCRHPQYIAFIMIMFGFLLQWPTIPTLVMFPILLVVYVRLAKHEERMAIKEFGDDYRRYMASTPAWIPKLRVDNSVSKQTG